MVWSRQADSSYTVRLNGKVVHKWTFKSDTTDDETINTLASMREFLLPAELLTKKGARSPPTLKLNAAHCTFTHAT